MVARVSARAVWIVLTAVMLTGCGRQVSRESTTNLDLLATGPDREVLPTPPPFLAAALNAAGGLPAWEQCKEIAFQGTVTARGRNGWSYLTEHDFVLCPWSDAIQVTAREPQANFVWQVVQGQYYAPQTDPNLDVSPLKGLDRDYAEAVLQIVTAPVRMLEGNAALTPRPAVAQITGQWYRPIEATYEAKKTGPKDKPVELHWTQGIYFQDQTNSLVDMVWLGNPGAKKFLIARGYDYAKIIGSDVLIPTKVEVFQSDPDANIGPRLALIDLRQ